MAPSRLGGTVDYYTMDEPLYFGHFYTADAKQGLVGKRSGCHLSIDEIAQDAAKRIWDVRSVFPDVKVGDVGGKLVASNLRLSAPMSRRRSACQVLRTCATPVPDPDDCASFSASTCISSSAKINSAVSTP
jgi:hypothetical protein